MKKQIDFVFMVQPLTAGDTSLQQRVKALLDLGAGWEVINAGVIGIENAGTGGTGVVDAFVAMAQYETS